MVRAIAFVLVALLLLSHAASAQKGQQIFEFFLQQADRELQRQQQRDYERQQRQEANRLHQQFLAQWHACHNDDLDACDQALAYPYLDPNDRRRLTSKRAQIIGAQQAAAERARQERLQAEAEERRQQREQEIRADHERAQDLARQRDEAERQRQRADQAERERLAAQAQLAALREAQLRAQEASQNATALIWTWTSVFAGAGIAILLSLVYLLRNTSTARSLWATLQQFKLPALSWSMLGAAAVFRQQPQERASEENTARETTDVADRVHLPPSAAPSPIADQPRDTPGAIAALELAHAYLEEVRDADTPGHDDKELRRNHLNTLALASKQLDVATKLDPDAILESQDDKETAYRYSIDELKAEALLLEGITHQTYDLKRAIPALVKATALNPNSARAFYVLGLTHAANMHKAEAVAAFDRAVALDPKNITYRKELNRAQSLSVGEVAAYKVTRAGEKIFDAGIKTANAGIFVYNIGVYTWNVFAFTWNVLTFPLRLVFKIFAFLGLMGAR